jgi:hypothetical protein
MKTQTNCSILQQGDSAQDHSHVRKSAPIDLKRKELAEVPVTPREKAVAKARRGKNVRPL